MFLFLLLSLLAVPRPLLADTFWHKVTWTTLDGVRLVGDYHPASRSRAYTWVLLHGLGSSKGEWDDFAHKLATGGSGVFIYDLRGHDESNQLTSGGTLSYKDWQSAGPGSPWDAMPSDLASAVERLKRKYDLPEAKIAVGGASLGANVALVYAASHPEVPALVLLSPGMEYAGIESGPAYQGYVPRPVFIAASPNDIYAYSSVRQLTGRTPNPHATVMDGPGGHGVNMFQDPGFETKLIDWMNTISGNRNRRPS